MNCLASRGCSTDVSLGETIAMQLSLKGIYEDNGYAISVVKIGEYEVFAIKRITAPVGSIFNDLSEAVNEFIKLTS